MYIQVITLVETVHDWITIVKVNVFKFLCFSSTKVYVAQITSMAKDTPTDYQNQVKSNLAGNLLLYLV